MTRPVLLGAMWFYLAVGLMLAVGGPALETIRADFGLSYTAVGFALGSPVYGYLPGSLLGGALSERAGRRRMIALAVGVMAAGLLATGFSTQVGVFVAASVVYGFAFGVTDPTLTALIGTAAGRRAHQALNFAQMTFGAGGLIAPPLVGAFLAAGLGWRPGFLIAGGLVASAALWFARLRYPPRRERPLPPRALLRAAAAPVPALLGVVVALYFGMQLGMSGFFAAHVERAYGLDRSAAASAVAVFWAGILAGRVASTWVIARTRPITLAAWSLLAAAGFATVVGLAPTAALAITGAGLVGLAIAPLFPSVLAIGVRYRPHAAGAVSGAVLAIGAAGGIIWGPLLGALADKLTVRAAMLSVPVMLLVALAALSLARRLMTRATPAAGQLG